MLRLEDELLDGGDEGEEDIEYEITEEELKEIEEYKKGKLLH